jgi:hypothetical protein
MDEQKLGRFVDVTGGKPMDDCLAMVALGVKPCRGACVEVGYPLRESLLRFEPKQIAKEVVVAKPGAGAVQTDQELIHARGVAQPLHTAGFAGDGIDKGATELVEDRCLQEALAIVRIDRGEELVAEILDNELIVAPECFDELAGVGGPSKRETREHEPGGPAFRAATELIEKSSVERLPRGTKQTGSLVGIEPQIGTANLRDLIAYS